VSGVGSESYSYDANNHRLKKVMGGVVTHYIWEGSQVIAEYERGGGLSGATGTRYYHQDRLSTRIITDGAGNVVGTADQLSFGEQIGGSGEEEKHKFTSYERDGTGLDYAVNRYYASQQGRFYQADPLGMGAASLADPQNMNLYSYVRNDPVNFRDPRGLDGEEITIRIETWEPYLRTGLGGDGSGPALELPVEVGGGGGGEQQGGGPSPQQQAINQAVAVTRFILSFDNPCSQTFGFWLNPPGRRDVRPALDALARRLQPGVILNNRTTGIEMSKFNTTGSVAGSSLEYRLPDRAIVNLSGPFYNAGRFGSFASNSLEGRTLAIFHELAHIIKIGDYTDRNRRINMYLIPPNEGSGRVETQEMSQQNSATVEQACGQQIRATTAALGALSSTLRIP
jgi:RHS repeat-associated protein